jgi:hypothetical protein
VFLEMFKAGEYMNFSLNNWIRHLPPEMVTSHLNLDANNISKIPSEALDGWRCRDVRHEGDIEDRKDVAIGELWRRRADRGVRVSPVQPQLDCFGSLSFFKEGFENNHLTKKSAQLFQ